MKEGAFDFIQKPVDLDHFKILIDRGAKQQELLRENLLLREEYAARYGFPRIVGEHPSMKAASEMAQRVAATDSTVLLLGESGTGKEVFARAIHHLSPRREQPFVALNCAAIPEGLVENELFGHERGAFTGAGTRKIGKIELAHRGTLFLDEIGDLPLAIQSQTAPRPRRTPLRPRRRHRPVEVNVRLIAATNRDLQAAVREKQFREDLYFRISAVPITIPPLRERGGDVVLLAEYFLDRFRREFRKPNLKLSPASRRLSRPTPGLATFASSKTPSSAPLFCPTVKKSTPRLSSFPKPRPAEDEFPANMLPEEFPLGRSARRSRPARRRSRRKIQNLRSPAPSQVEQNPRRRIPGRLLQNSPLQNPLPRPRKLAYQSAQLSNSVIPSITESALSSRVVPYAFPQSVFRSFLESNCPSTMRPRPASESLDGTLGFHQPSIRSSPTSRDHDYCFDLPCS